MYYKNKTKRLIASVALLSQMVYTVNPFVYAYISYSINSKALAQEVTDIASDTVVSQETINSQNTLNTESDAETSSNFESSIPTNEPIVEEFLSSNLMDVDTEVVDQGSEGDVLPVVTGVTIPEVTPQVEANQTEEIIVAEPSSGIEVQETKPEVQIPNTIESSTETTDDSPETNAVVESSFSSGEILDSGSTSVRTTSEPSDFIDAKEQVNGMECLDTEASIITSTTDMWEVDSATNTAKTKGDVQTGIRYEFPLNKDVAVTFTCLPKDTQELSSLKIQQVKVSELNLPKGTTTSVEYAYDITSDMPNGSFEYEVVLPKPILTTTELIYIEKSIDDATNEDLVKSDLKKVSSVQIEQTKNLLTASELNHFTIFLIVDGTNIPDFSNDWLDFYDTLGNLVTDVEDGKLGMNDESNGGTNVTPAEIDIGSAVDISGTNSGNQSSLQYYYEDNNTGGTCSDDTLFLRMRLEGNPEASGNSGSAYSSYHWDFLLDANNNGTSDFVIDVFGGKTNSFDSSEGGQSGSIGLYPNDANSTSYTTDNVLWTARADDGSNLYTQVEKDDYGDAIASNDQFWMEAAVPLNVNAAFQAAVCNLTDLDGLVFASTSTSNTDPLQKDWMNPVGFFTSHVEHKSVENLTNAGATTVLDPAAAGDIIEYTLSVTNDGTREIPGFIFSDDISDILAYATLVNGDTDGNGKTGTVVSNTISWPQQDIAVGQTLTEQFSVQINSASLWNGTDFTMTNVYGDTVNVYLQSYGYVTVNKIVIAHGASKVAADFGPFKVGDTTVTLGETTAFPVGTYTISETTDANYIASFSNDCPNGEVTVTVNSTAACTITNERIVINPKITLIKEVINDNGGTATSNDFGLSIGGTSVTSGQTVEVTAGTPVALNEVGLTGYSFVSMTGANCPSNLGDSVTLAEGDDITCTITNDDVAPLLTVTKVVVNDNGGTKQVSDFPLFVDTTQVTSGVQNGFNTGSYTVSETSINGYTSTFSGDCDAQGQVSLSLGNVKTCTITNDDVEPLLTVTKVVVNDNGGVSVVSDFNLYVDSTQVSSGVQNGFIAGNHTVSEANNTEYTGTISGDCSADGSITLEVGDVKTCLITNDDRIANLTVKKVVINDNGGDKEPSDFSFSVNDGPSVAFEADGENVLAVNAGTYSVVEENAQGYTTTYDNCSNIVLPNGGSAICTVTNDDQPGTLIVKKVVVNDNGGNNEVTDFSFTVNSGDAIAFEADGQNDITVDASIYSVEEVATAGYDATYDNCIRVSIPNGGSATCTITNNDIAPSLTLTKEVINDNNGTATANDFGLSIGGVSVTSGQKLTLNANEAYALNEVGLYGYTFKEITGDAKCPAVLGGEITLAEGDDLTCTIVNDDVAAKLTVTKIVEGGTNQVSDFPLFVDATSVTSGETNEFNQGSYTVSETNQTGYTGVISGDCDANGSITLNVGDTKACTITNTRDTGTIKVTKIVDSYLNDSSTWDITISGPTNNYDTLANGESTSAFVSDTGSYTISETAHTGTNGGDYTSTYECKDGENTLELGNGIGTEITGLNLEKNQDVECTFTNSVKRGSITIVKDAQPDSEEDFRFTAKIPNLDDLDFYLDDDGDNTNDLSNTEVLSDLLPGTYNITEPHIQYWTLESVTCEGGSDANANERNAVIKLQPGENVTCTFVNTINRGSVTVTKYLDENANGTRDEGEVTLPDWLINLSHKGSVDTLVTNSDGQVTFENLLPKTYTLSEDLSEGWYQSNISCTGDTGIDTSNEHQVIVNPEDQISCEIGNYQNSEIKVVKRILNPQGEEVTDLTTEFLFELAGVLDADELTENLVSENLGDDESFTTSVKPGTYQVTEVADANYDFKGCSALYEETSVGESITNGKVVTVGSGDRIVITCDNWQKPSTITGSKWEDKDQSSQRDENEPLLPDWTIYIDTNGNSSFDDGEVSTKTDENGNYTFNLNPGTYKICEVIPSEWIQTYPDFNDNLDDFREGSQITQNNCYILTVGPNETIGDNTFGNFHELPSLLISKFNNKGGIDLRVGDEVTYTIEVTSNDSTAYGVKAIDLLPKGIKYKASSYTANSSVRGDISGLGEPTYNSPGTWTLGDLIAGEIVTLTYVGFVEAGTDEGTYKDLAWAVASEQGVLALAEEDGNKLATNFVGTEVQVVKDPVVEDLKVDVGEDEKIKEIGEVLGASTSLPATGSPTSLFAALLIWLVLGLGALMVTRKKSVKLPNPKVLSLLNIFAGIIVASFIFTPSASATAPNNLFVRLEEPKATTNVDFNLSFVALDSDNNKIEVQCFKKGPSDGVSYVAFGAPIILNNGGDTGICEAKSTNILTNDGSYWFKVSAKTLTENPLDSVTSESEEWKVDYDGNGPGKPFDIEKDKDGNCQFELSFKTANDGETSYVEIYRDDDREFTADATKLHKTISIGPNTSYKYEDDLYGSECGKNFYYGVRAFDANGYGSALGQEEDTETTKEVTITTTETKEETGAVLGGGSSIEVGGEENADSEVVLPGDVLGESDKGNATEDNESINGGVLGSAISKLKNPKVIGLLIAALLLLAYGYYRAKKSK
ncbi:DUF11 domain-containing protein [candidate division WWE3 bacterium]|nr:DUF11 domain-containing protein [candidate division WWE3 bacterium]